MALLITFMFTLVLPDALPEPHRTDAVTPAVRHWAELGLSMALLVMFAKAVHLARAAGERESLARALEQFTSLFRMDLPPVRRGKESEPGYDEVLSRTHNPFTAREQFERAGFCDVKVLFYHYHCLPPLLESAAPALFRARSVAMEKPDDWRGHFMASAFILSGVAS